MKSDLRNLLLAQISAPAARIAFVFFLVPIHPHPIGVMQVLALSELLSTFLTSGRNYLIQSGFRHHLFGRLADKAVLILLTSGAFFLFSSDEQQAFTSGVIVVTIAVSSMTMLNAVFLKDRHLLAILPLNFVVYVIVAFGVYMTPAAAIVALAIWLLIEHSLPEMDIVPPKRFLPVAATLMAFASQRIDVQISALSGNANFLRRVSTEHAVYATCFVRPPDWKHSIASGSAMLSKTWKTQGILFSGGLAYAVGVYVVGTVLKNTLITQGILIIAFTMILSALTITYRETISMLSISGQFMPLFIFSVLGLVPSAAYMAMVASGNMISQIGFLAVLYLAPRILMLLYGISISLKNKHA